MAKIHLDIKILQNILQCNTIAQRLMKRVKIIFVHDNFKCLGRRLKDMGGSNLDFLLKAKSGYIKPFVFTNNLRC